MFARSGVVVFACACSVSAGEPALDAGSPADAAVFVPGPNMVQLSTIGPYDLVMYRDGTGPWTTARRTGRGRYELHVTSAYDVVGACTDGRFSEGTMLKRTFADGAEASMFCLYFYEPDAVEPPPTVLVSGQMEQPGELFFGDWGFERSPSAPWSFAFEVEPGMHDLIAVGEQRMAIRRGLAIDAPQTVPSVDLEVEGVELTTTQLTVSAPRPTETISSWLLFVTEHGFGWIDGTPHTLRLPPTTAMQPSDLVAVTVVASAETTSRVASAYSFATELELPPLPVVDYSFPDNRTLWASWKALPPFTSVALDAIGYEGAQWVEATASYLAEHGSTHLAFEPLPSEYKRVWQVGFAGPYVRALSLYDEQAAGYRASHSRESVNGAFAGRTYEGRSRISPLVDGRRRLLAR